MRTVSCLLTGIAVVLTGCDGGEDASSPPEPPSATPLANATCVTIEHENQKLGVTVPAGFTAATPPAEAAEIAETYQVNLLSLAHLADSDPVPTAALAVYGYGPGERAGQRALEASVLNFKDLTGGTSRGNPISATPTPVAGTQGSAGGDKDPRALDHNAQDTVDSTLRWWTIPTSGGLFIVTLATTTIDQDTRYSTEVPAGLTLGGC